MHRGLLKAGALSGVLSVILGAFGAHALKSRLSPDSLAVFETGVRYQMFHTIAIILSGVLYKDFPFKSTVLAGQLFILGIILFSGSLYVMTIMKVAGNENFSWIGAITPLGGAAFICGWLLLLKSFYSKSPL